MGRGTQVLEGGPHRGHARGLVQQGVCQMRREGERGRHRGWAKFRAGVYIAVGRGGAGRWRVVREGRR